MYCWKQRIKTKKNKHTCTPPPPKVPHLIAFIHKDEEEIEP